jgi:lipopolysaccharide assembly outer membrane protein LptD (OstA)
LRFRLRIQTAIALLALAGAPAAAQLADDDMTLRIPAQVVADEIEAHVEREIYIARGNVVITQGDRKLEADWAMFNNITQEGVASGNVVLTELDDVVHASFIQFDVDTLTGVLYDGNIDSGERGFRLMGREVRKTGTDTYSFDDGVFTTCRCPDEGREPWKIKADEADLEVEGYGTARNTTFEVLGVPVAWFPWMIYPLKTKRQTGFLFPDFKSSGRNGTEIGLPFFWAVRHDLNLTLNPLWMSDRGFKPEVEIEYVFGEESWVELYGSVLQGDREVDRNDPDTPFDDDRWGVKWRHDQFLPHDIRFQADVAAVSDNDYPFDFGDFTRYRNDRFIRSRGFFSMPFGEHDRFGLVAGATFADDLQNPDDIDRDDFLLQRLPDVEFSMLPERLGWLSRLVPALDANYTYFRSLDDTADEFENTDSIPGVPAIVGEDHFVDTGLDGLLDPDEGPSDPPVDAHKDNFPLSNGTQGDRIFQEGELLADRGNRLLLTPRLGMPLRMFDLFEIYPEVGYHTTVYETRGDDFEERGLVTARVDLRTRLRREYSLPFGIGEALHLLEPHLGYALVQERGQSRNPLFVPQTATPQERVRQLDLDNITLDPSDRIQRHNRINFGFNNRVYGRGEGGGLGTLLADVTLSTQYLASNSRFGHAYVDGTVFPLPGWKGQLILGYDLDEPKLSEALFGFAWASPSGHDLRVQYRYLRDIPEFFENFRKSKDRFDEFDEDFDRVNQVTGGARVALPWRLALTYDAAFSFESSLTLQNRGGVEYTSKCRCWAIRAEFADSRTRGFDFGFKYTVLGLGKDTVRPFSRGGGFDL